MKYQKNVIRNFTYFFQVSINMIVPIVLCMFIGIFLDRIFHTSFIAIIMFFLGAGAGFRNIYIYAKNSGGNKTSYIGSDQESKINDMMLSEETGKEDFLEKIDRVHKENMNEQT